MTKKILLSIFVTLALIFVSSYVLAANNLDNNSTNTTGNVSDAIGGTLSNVTHGIGNVAGGIGNTISNGINSMTGNNSNRTSDSMTSTGTTSGNGYTATRTSANTQTNNTGLSNTAITWIILAITAAIIVALIWYYGTQDDNVARDFHND